MLNATKITPHHLQRTAIVYVRQSSLSQVSQHQESQRLQYALEDEAYQLNFQRVEVLDSDLGFSASGSVERAGFEYLVQQLTANKVGAIFCLQACRLARNGREWQTLLELAAYSHTLLIDSKTVYDPGNSHDRLLLGLQGSFAEYELSALRQRALEAKQSRAERGELKFQLPLGLCWTKEGKIIREPDLQNQAVLFQVFEKFRTLGSARQVYLWFVDNQLSFPRLERTDTGQELCWTKPTYQRLLQILKNPLYAGAYAYGRTTHESILEGGKVRKRRGKRKGMEEWEVLLKDNHEGYISWQEYEANQLQLEDNMPMTEGRLGPPRKGKSLLSGLLRCGHCGQKMAVSYPGRKASSVRYRCKRDSQEGRPSHYLSLNGRKLEELVVEELLKSVQPRAIEAAFVASQELELEQERICHLLELELERGRYEASLAARRYKQVDPDNRLVASSLERDWNEALEKVSDLEERLAEQKQEGQQQQKVTKEELESLASDLSMVWEHPDTEPQTKQQIARLLLEEIIVEEENDEVHLVLHWSGGRHSELRVAKDSFHQSKTPKKTIETLREMAAKYSDREVASQLNAMGAKTAKGLEWTARRVRAVRRKNNIPSRRSTIQKTRG